MLNNIDVMLLSAAFFTLKRNKNMNTYRNNSLPEEYKLEIEDLVKDKIDNRVSNFNYTETNNIKDIINKHLAIFYGIIFSAFTITMFNLIFILDNKDILLLKSKILELIIMHTNMM